MLPRALRKNTPQSITTALVYAIPFVVMATVGNSETQQWSSKSILTPYFEPITSVHWLNTTIGTALLLFTAGYTQHVFNKYRLFKSANQFPFILTLALLTCSSNVGVVSPWICGSLLVIRLLDRALDIQRANKANMIILEASFTAGILWVFSSEYIWAFPIVFLAYLYSGSVQIKGFVMSIVGFLLPSYFFISLNYLFDHPRGLSELELVVPKFDFIDTPQYTLLIGCLIVVIIGFRYFLKSIVVNKIIIKNHLVLVIVLSAMWVFSSAFSANSISDLVAGSFLGFSLLAGLYFANATKTWLMEATFYVWYLCVVAFLYLTIS